MSLLKSDLSSTAFSIDVRRESPSQILSGSVQRLTNFLAGHPEALHKRSTEKRPVPLQK
jgi:CRP-like cAMP-binding protein